MAARLLVGRGSLRLATATPAQWRLLPTVQMTLRSYSTDLPEHIVVKMPALSPTMTHGTILDWNVKIGEEVAAGDSLGEIETDKASMSFDSSEEGYIAKFLVEPNTKDIPLGTPVLVLCEEEEDVPKFADYVPEAEAETAPATSTPEPAAPAPVAAAPSTPPPAPATPTPVVASSSNSALDNMLRERSRAALRAKYPNGVPL
eukprot:m.54824 g.54824  ORF g.54824 m.54824 type:complete len:202 (-) comp10953_c0_seq3:6485-7090(-)